jgi:phosphopantetheinyl transferase (holo-ACP synthase)
MPFTSKAQARFMFARHPGIAKEFAAKTSSIKALPEHVGKKKKRNFDSFASGKPFGKG